MAICVALPIIASQTALAEDIPFAVAPDLRPNTNNAYVPSLSEIMQIVQLKHIKLWEAGSSANWLLAAFEVNQLRDTFKRIAFFYDSIPVSHVVAVAAPLQAMRDAAVAGDQRAYRAGYAGLTAACNACHTAARVGFIVITNPTTSPFVDQKF